MLHHYLVLAATLLLRSDAHPYLLTDWNLCETLDIRHGNVPPENQLNPENIQVRLTNNGEDSTCYKPGFHYNVTIKSNSLPIYGLLFLQPKGDVVGTFPYVDSSTRGNLIKAGLTDHFCENAVSHKCLHQKRGEYYSKCSLGTTINLPFLAPNNRNKAVLFRFSLVLRTLLFLENEEVTFPACPCEEGECGGNNYEVCDASEFRFQETTKKVSTTCDKDPGRSEVVRHIVENGVNYTCIATVRMNICKTGCEKKKETLCCRSELTKRMRNFNCVPTTPGKTITRRMEATEGRKCECFLCKEVCPVVPPAGNSVEVEHEDNDVDNGNDTDNSNVNTLSDEDVTLLYASTMSSSSSTTAEGPTGIAEETPTNTDAGAEVQGLTSNKEEVQRSTTSSETVLDSV